MKETTLSYYRKIVELFGASTQTNLEDSYIRNEELNFIFKELKFHLKKELKFKLLDVGCGHGYLIEQIFQKFPKSVLEGVEIDPELYDQARDRGLQKVNFFCMNFADYEVPTKTKFDFVITERVLTNVINIESRSKVLKNISDSLKKNGIYIMIECFEEPLLNLNKAREEMKLEKIESDKQASYLSETLITDLQKLRLKEIKTQSPRNQLSSYFYITHCFHHLLNPKAELSTESEFVNFFKEALPKNIGNYSPILFRTFQKM
jgi:SAM-dependent methyltransferase